MLVRLIAIVAAGFAFAGSAVTLLGWGAGLPLLTDWDRDGIAMLTNTAVAATTAGAAMLLLLFLPPSHRNGPGWWVIAVLAGITTLIGGLTFAQHLFGWDLWIDTLLIDPRWGERAATSPGRMGPPASLTFLLLGTALLLTNAPLGSRRRRVAVIIATAAAIPPIVAWTAYFYGADPLYSVPRFTGIARQTAGILFCLALALILTIEERGLGKLFRADDTGGTLIRRLLPISIVLLLVTGWLEDAGESRSLYGPDFGNAVLTVVRVLMFTALLWWTARAVTLQVHRRRTLEAELSESQERFSVMVDTIPQLAWMASPDGWIYWYNQRWYEYTGTTPEQMEGWGWTAVHDPAALPAVLKRWKASIASGEPFDMAFPLRGADGVFRTFLTRTLAVRDADGNVLHWFGTNTDISEQRAAEDALREANRMKDEFLATLSHELRTPMSAILGWSQMLRGGVARGDGAAPRADLAQGLEVIERNARLQSQIIEDLLDMNRIISGKVRLDVQSIDIGEVLHAAVDSIRPSADAKGLRLHLLCDPGIQDLRGDPNRLQQVFYNLLTNAVKFTPKGGRIEVICARVNSHVEISVSDTGVGIKPEFLPHMFERFRQQDASTTRSFGGLGLGLSISRHLVELHGGTIHVASAGEGQGSTFTVHLPISVAILPAVDEGVAGRHHPRASPWTGSETMPEIDQTQLTGVTALVVDDEADARDLLRRLLDEHGARTIVAGSADEAFEMLRRDLPDIMICDIGMPGRDGYDLIQSVRALEPDQGGRTPAIALTAFARAEDRIRSIRAGFQMHLSKPVETAELLASIASLAGESDRV